MAVANFFVQLGQAIYSWGMAALGAIINALTAVANAIQSAAQVFEKALEWLFTAIANAIHALLDPLIKVVTDAYNAWAKEVANLILEFGQIPLTDFVASLAGLVFYPGLAIAVLAVIVGFSVAEKITLVMSAGLVSAASFAIKLITDVIIGMLIISAVSQWLGSNLIENLLPPYFDEITGAAFTIAGLVFALELKHRELTPVEGVESALKDYIISLFFLMVSTTIVAIGGMRQLALIALVILDVLALAISLFATKAQLKIAGRGANFIKMFYPFLYPVSVTMNAISTVTSITDLVSDSGKLNQSLRSG